MYLILDTQIRELGPANTVFKSEYLSLNTEIQDSIRIRYRIKTINTPPLAGTGMCSILTFRNVCLEIVLRSSNHFLQRAKC